MQVGLGAFDVATVNYRYVEEHIGQHVARVLLNVQPGCRIAAME